MPVAVGNRLAASCVLVAETVVSSLTSFSFFTEESIEAGTPACPPAAIARPGTAVLGSAEGDEECLTEFRLSDRPPDAPR